VPSGTRSISPELTQGLRPFGKLRAGSGLLSVAPPELFFLRFRAQQAPGFLVALVAVAICPDGFHGKEHWARRLTAAVEKDPRRDEVPGFWGDDVASEEVKLPGSVLPAVRVGLELTAVSVVDAVAGGLDLDPEDAVAEVEGDVEGLGVSPGLEDGVTAAKGFGYELGFHPLAAFLEGPESIALSHHPLPGLPLARSPTRPKEKARPEGRALIS